MTTTPLGTFTIGALNLAAAQSVGQLTTALAGPLKAQGALTAKISGLTNMRLPSPTAVAASLSVGASLGLTAFNPVKAAAQAAANLATLQGELSASMALTGALTGAIASLNAVINVGGVAAYAQNGAASTMAEIASQVASDLGGSTNVRALVLVTTTDAAWAALSATMKTS